MLKRILPSLFAHCVSEKITNIPTTSLHLLNRCCSMPNGSLHQLNCVWVGVCLCVRVCLLLCAVVCVILQTVSGHVLWISMLYWWGHMVFPYGDVTLCEVSILTAGWYVSPAHVSIILQIILWLSFVQPEANLKNERCCFWIKQM